LNEPLNRKGLRAAVITYSLWGLVPLYWKHLAHVSSLELMIQRVIWSCLFYFILLMLMNRVRARLTSIGRREWPRLSPQLWLQVAGSGLLLSINWYAYVTAVNAGHVLESSLAYFLTPLINVALGRFVFKEHLSKSLKAALVFAGLGVALMFTKINDLPWLAVVMGVSFSLYGMMKKQVRLAPLESAFFEMLILLPAAGLILYQLRTGAPEHSSHDWFLISASGLITGLPILFFTQAAQLLPYSVLGFFQFIPPTVAFLLALGFFHEPFGWTDLIAFLLIWMGVGLYLLSLTRFRPKSRAIEM
jgi:chloramphenicol-sensitive protein RarD